MALGTKELIFIAVFAALGAIFLVCCFCRYCRCKGWRKGDSDERGWCEFGFGGDDEERSGWFSSGGDGSVV